MTNDTEAALSRSPRRAATPLRRTARTSSSASATSSAASSGARTSSAGSSRSASPRCSIALLAATGAAVGLTDTDAAEATDKATTIGIVGGVLLLIVLLVAYYFGGYVAGRMARFNGPRQGLGVWLIGLVVTIALAVAGALFGAEYNVLSGLNLPRIPVGEGSLDHRRPDRARRGHRRHAARRDRRRQGRHPLPPQGRPSRPGMSTHNPKEASMATTEHDVLSWRGQNLIDSHGDKIGKIEEIYLDADSNAPEWALVTTGMFGTKQSFVPIQDATPGENGDGISVPFEKATVKDAPKIDPDGKLSEQEEADLYRHYGRETRRPRDQGVSSAGRPLATGERGGQGQDVSGPNTDEAMTRLRGGAARRHHRARSRPRAPEEVRRRGRGHRDRPGAPRRGPPRARADHRRQPRRRHRGSRRSQKRSTRSSCTPRSPSSTSARCPKERVRLEKDVTTTDETVSDTVRQERVDVDDSRR